MTHKINIASLPEFDASHYLDSEAAIAEYLTAIIDDGDSALLAAALGDIALLPKFARRWALSSM